MALEFIDLAESSPKDSEFPHNSSLSFSEKWEGLRVLGVLTHGFEFEPRNVAAARKLIDWLERWILKQEENENRAEILESIARTLFVMAFADACDDEERTDIDQSQAAGPGDDWFDTVTDETPKEAESKARDIAADFEARNGRTLESAGEQWAALEFYYGGGRDHGLGEFGHCLAMRYLGTGVGLWDDYKGENPDGFECGYAEFYL